MPETTELNLTLEKQMVRRLAKLATCMKRSQSSIVTEALEQFIATHEWQIAGIEKATESADRGRLVATDDVRAWVQGLGIDTEIPKP